MVDDLVRPARNFGGWRPHEAVETVLVASAGRATGTYRRAGLRHPGHRPVECDPDAGDVQVRMERWTTGTAQRRALVLAGLAGAEVKDWR